MAEQSGKKLDAVTIIGVAIGIALMVGGYFYSQARFEKQKRDYEAQVAKHNAELEAWKKANAPALPPSELNTANPSKTNGTTNTAGNGTTPPAADAEPADAGDIKVSTGTVDLVFTARGAALKKADFNKQYEDAAKKTKLGLEFLSEITPGMTTFSIPSFEVGPADISKQAERVTFDKPAGAQKAPQYRVWKLVSNDGAFNAQGEWKIVYSSALGAQYTLQRTFTVYKERQYLGADLAVISAAGEASTFSYQMYGPAGVLLDGPPENPKAGAIVSIKAELAGRTTESPGAEPDVVQVYAIDASTKAEADRSMSKPENVWALLKNRFFLAALVPIDPGQVIKFTAVSIPPATSTTDLRYTEPNMVIVAQRRLSPPLAPKATATDRYAMYLGPMVPQMLIDTEAQLGLAQPVHLSEGVQFVELFYYRWPRLDKLARGMLWVFGGLHAVFGNYGIAVILLTLVIKLVMHPLQRKMMISMDKMQKLQPEIAKINEKYKNAKGTEAQMKKTLETQDLMKRAGANPAGGCLPMLVQIPIFSALYGIFYSAFDIRGAGFLWIKDLSSPDRLARFGSFDLNLLPIIYAAMTIIQSRMSAPPPSDDPQQEINRKMMQYMPLMFTFIFYGMPSGLVLYFAAQSVFGMLEYWYIKKFILSKNGPLPSSNSGKPPAPVVN